MKKQQKEALIAACFLAGLLIIFFSNAIFTGKALIPTDNIFEQPFYKLYAPEGFIRPPNILLSDQSLQFYPLQHFIAQRLKSGSLPIWTPHILLGIPIAGTGQSALFYPWNLLGAFFSLGTLLWLRAFLNFWIAGIFIFLLVRRIGGSKAGAYLTSVSFMFCGFLIAWLGHPHSNAAVWLPALLYLSELIVTSKRFKEFYLGATSIIIGFVILGGHMETAFEVCLIWFLFYLIRAYQVFGIKKIPKNIFIAISTMLFGVLVAAIQVLPFLEWLINSAEFARRKAHLFVFLDWSFLKKLPSLFALIIPNLCINSSQIDFPCIDYIPWGNFNEISFYIGILPLIIAMQGIWLAKRNKDKIILFAGGALFFLCLAYRLPIFDLVNQLPVFSMFAVGRYRLVFDLGMAIVAGLTFDVWVSHLSKGKNWKRTGKFLFLFGICIVLFILMISLFLSYFKAPILEYGKKFATVKYNATLVHSRPLDLVLCDIDKIFYELTKYFSMSNWRLYFPGVVLILTAGLIYLWARKKINTAIFKYSIIVFTLIDLFVFGIGYNPVAKAEHVYPETPAIKFLKQDTSVFRILPVRMEWVSSGPLVYGIDEIGGADLPTRYYDEFTDIIDGKDGLGFMFYSSKSASSKLIDLLNVKYIVTTNLLKSTKKREFLLRWHEDDIYIYENPKVFPRAFVVHKAQVLTEEKILETLKDESFDPRVEVLLSKGENIDIQKVDIRKEEIEVLEYQPEHVIIKTKTIKKGMLVISDAYYPGWNAYLDDRKTTIYRANFVMRAVELPAGMHEVEFKYEPRSIYIGKKISLISFGLLVFMGLVLFFRRKLIKR